MQLPHVSRLHSLESQERHIDRRSRQIETWLEMHGIKLVSAATSTLTPDGRHEHPPLDRMVQSAPNMFRNMPTLGEDEPRVFQVRRYIDWGPYFASPKLVQCH